MHSQAFCRRIGRVWCCELVCWNVCGLIPAVSTGLSQFPLPSYVVPALKPAGTDPLCSSTGNIFSRLNPSALLHSTSHHHVFFTLSCMLGLTSLSPHKSLTHELLASLPTYFCIHFSRKSMHLEEHCKQVKLYITREKSLHCCFRLSCSSASHFPPPKYNFIWYLKIKFQEIPYGLVVNHEPTVCLLWILTWLCTNLHRICSE